MSDINLAIYLHERRRKGKYSTVLQSQTMEQKIACYLQNERLRAQCSRGRINVYLTANRVFMDDDARMCGCLVAYDETVDIWMADCSWANSPRFCVFEEFYYDLF